MRYSDIIQTPLPAKPSTPYKYAIISNVFFILAQFIAKTQTTIVSPIFIIYYRSLLMLVINSLLIWWQNIQIKKKINELKQDIDITLSQILYQQQKRNVITLNIIQKKTFIIIVKRVIFSSISTVLFTMSLQHLKLSVTNALFETAPIFSLFIDLIINKVKIMTIHVVVILVAVVGVGVMTLAQLGRQGESESSGMVQYMLLPLAAALTSSCSVFYLHKMKHTVHPLLVVEYLMIGSILLSGTLFNFHPNQQIILPPNPIYQKILSFDFIFGTIIMSLFLFGSQYYRVKSLFIVPASMIAPVHYVGIVLAILVDLVMFGYNIKWYEYIGMAMACNGLFVKLITDKSANRPRQQTYDYTHGRF